MASFMDTEGSVVKEINIQRKSINGSQVSAVLAVSYRFVFKFYLRCNPLPSLPLSSVNTSLSILAIFRVSFSKIQPLSWGLL